MTCRRAVMTRPTTLLLSERSVTRVVPNHYVFNSARPHRWLQRLCIAILARLGCQASTTSLELARVHTTWPDRVVDAVLAQSRMIRELAWDENLAILIGPEEYANLAGEQPWPHTFTPLATWGKATLGRHEAGRRRTRLCGMPVYVIPWLEGCLVVPQDVIVHAAGA